MGVIANPEHRIGIFIDIQNLYHSAKHLHGSRVNYRELLNHLTAGRRLIRTLAYVVTSDPQTGEDAFFDALEKSGIELRNKELQTFSSGAKKADWDVGMAVDIIRMAHGFDVIIIVTGDGDFIPLVEYLQTGLGKIVEVAAFARTASGKLKEQADEFIDIDGIPKVIFRTEKSRKKSPVKEKQTTPKKYESRKKTV
ncbi:MAG: NYN domain-containing protein [Candidatus Colwellbacteria bacterium]|nr:NYN domain-containing protein [Candidatus Colwellbacteria bacterium]